MMRKIISYSEKQVESVPFYEFTYKQSKNTDIDLLISFPKQNNPKSCLFFIHGGGWKSETKERLKKHALYASLNGAVGVSISYRLLSGEERIDVRDGLEDCLDALEYVRKVCDEKYGDIKYVSIGDSAGGYYATCLGCSNIVKKIRKDFKLVDYVVDLNGITDLTKKWNYGIIKKDFDVSDKSVIEKEFSPIYNVSSNDAPVYIIHGEDDKTVDITESIIYYETLKKFEINCDIRILKNTTHAFILFDYKHDNEYVSSILESIMQFLKTKDLI